MFPDSSPERSALVAARKNGVNTEELWTQLRRRFIKSGSVLEVQRATLVIGLFQRSARPPDDPARTTASSPFSALASGQTRRCHDNTNYPRHVLRPGRERIR